MPKIKFATLKLRTSSLAVIAQANVIIAGNGSYVVPANWTYEIWIERETCEDKWGHRHGGPYRIQVGQDKVRSL